jgi:tetratricopeptide (TPR) repeat protein
MACWCRGKCPHIVEPNALIKAGNVRQAENILRRNLSEAPLCVDGNLLMTEMMNTSNRSHFAQIHVERAAKVEGQSVRMLLAAGANYRQQARPELAEGCFRLARDIDAKNATAWAGLIGALEAQGRLDEAVIEGDDAYSAFSKEMPPALRYQVALAVLEHGDAAGAAAVLNEANMIPMERLLRGRAKEKLGDYAGAWTDWTEAKRELAEKHGHKYWREHFTQLFAGLYEISQPARYKMFKSVPTISHPQPLFVTGFPRSGTTMLETALAAHSAIIDGDELGGISDVVQALPRFLKSPLPYPQCLLATTLGDNGTALTVMAKLYLEKSVEKIGRDRCTLEKNLFTDKMPMNTMHLPLIRLMFPSASLVYIRRHPLDIFVSCMSHNLAHGGHFAESLETLAEHYAGAESLYQHYKNVLPDTGLEIKYEDLVADFETELQDLMFDLGLELEPACIAFHESTRQSHTISYRQIKKPLYKSSVARFKNFLPYLEPALPWIEPILKREGYNL